MTFNSEEETYNWAVEFGKSLRPGDMVALYGNLGAGKTVMSRGICKGLGFEGSVCSPTYTILHEYPNEPPLFHFDLYRLEPGAELYEVGLDHDYLSKGITLIEWPERLDGDTGDITHKITIEIISENVREVKLETFDRKNG
ncbi:MULTISPECIES: tRNA (adenosine(37)-N6)-threonylcarbamoyltransferase complex ATPase subunit type 1 TsaE [unclassified Fibrobacter]|jgi:tRNA threonylcarbamoyladenosine biosynthesis protein TsaE|uniref:tRNA (adenosine(37)-N6)-threonylcarbamoyltransferase complex ATPase subunit type 1 TsaE n=1 Tax=unclassified Fibrobacter TaxID=2634177 RepID=UPI0015638E4C|nr:MULTISPECIES: tRNA (adenosine(37)-N6)-threonylcarbamoyltransferase complex ATPase subunit type 1 TsaE [unclassified Fibrobacter]